MVAYKQGRNNEGKTKTSNGKTMTRKRLGDDNMSQQGEMTSWTIC